MSMMKLCLGVETTQSIVSVICQLVFLVSYNDINDPMMSTQAKILFGLNIFTSMMTVIVSLVMLFMKQMLLKEEKRQSVAVEFGGIYKDNNESGMQVNPLHERNENDVRTENNKLKEKVDDLESKNAGLESKVYDLESENTDLKNENASLKKKLKKKNEKMKADKDVNAVTAL